MNGDLFQLIQGLGHKLVVTVITLMVAVIVIHLLIAFWRSRNVLAVLSVLVLGGVALWGMDNVDQIKRLIDVTIRSLGGG